MSRRSAKKWLMILACSPVDGVAQGPQFPSIELWRVSFTGTELWFISDGTYLSFQADVQMRKKWALCLPNLPSRHLQQSSSVHPRDSLVVLARSSSFFSMSFSATSLTEDCRCLVLDLLAWELWHLGTVWRIHRVCKRCTRKSTSSRGYHAQRMSSRLNTLACFPCSYLIRSVGGAQIRSIIRHTGRQNFAWNDFGRIWEQCVNIPTQTRSQITPRLIE